MTRREKKPHKTALPIVFSTFSCQMHWFRYLTREPSDASISLQLKGTVSIVGYDLPLHTRLRSYQDVCLNATREKEGENFEMRMSCHSAKEESENQGEDCTRVKVSNSETSWPISTNCTASRYAHICHQQPTNPPLTSIAAFCVKDEDSLGLLGKWNSKTLLWGGNFLNFIDGLIDSYLVAAMITRIPSQSPGHLDCFLLCPPLFILWLQELLLTLQQESKDLVCRTARKALWSKFECESSCWGWMAFQGQKQRAAS